jgi:16S rRNA (uracil1498-N3)-methyltransferase
MVERQDRPTVARFFAHEEFRPGSTLTLSEESAHHIRVARIGLGERVGLRDGAGGVGGGVLVKTSRSYAAVEVDVAEHIPPPPPIHLLAPIGDRDRMLMLAEKCAEIGIASWRPVLWKRSRSVSPRGEGSSFTAKTRARMVSALLQSGAAWLPDSFPEAPPQRAVAACPGGTRLVLDPHGEPLVATSLLAPLSIALGPEGGLEGEETDRLLAAGFRRASLGSSILRFETAGILAVGVASMRLAQLTGAAPPAG